MNKSLITTLFIIYMTAGATTAAEASNAGITTANFLKIGVGARQISIGEAFCAVADDANTIYWNSAGLAQIKEIEASFTLNRWFNNTSEQAASFAYPMDEDGVLGVGLLHVGSGNIVGRDNTGALTAPFSAHGVAGVFSYAGLLSGNNIMGGISLKTIYQNLADISAVTLALDLGFLAKFPDYNIGLSIQNLGPGQKFITETNALPINFKLGGMYSINETSFLALDINIPIDNNIKLGLGIENHINEIFCLRFGYTTKIEEGPGISAGFGIFYKQFEFDYAFTPYSKLGFSHLLTFGYIIPTQ